jgi:MFS family permease
MIKTIRELREFLILWGSQTVSLLGTTMTNYAVIIWVYGQNGSALQLALMSVFTLIPSILFGFIAGAISDKWDKKRIMLIADLVAAMGSAAVLALYSADALEIWHLYVINFLLSFMNAFQNPASYVATGLLVSQKHYTRASGMQSISGAAANIIAPALGGALLALAGFGMVLIIDLATFAVAFFTLLFAVKIPKIQSDAAEEAKESLLKTCASGLTYLKRHTTLLKFILFFSFIGFISKFSWGMIAPLTLGRTGNNQIIYGIGQTAAGIGVLSAGLLISFVKPAKRRIKTIFISCGLSFLLGELLLSLTHSLPYWIFAVFASNFPLAFLNANKTSVMRTYIPVELQGRVYAAQGTIDSITGILGYLAAGFLADRVLEPFMSVASPVQSALSRLFGSGAGSGVALMFFAVGVTGAVSSYLMLRNTAYKELENNENQS